jgi:hypothetical protein
MSRESREGRGGLFIEMIENAGLAGTYQLSGLRIRDVPGMTGEKDPGVQIQEASNIFSEHGRR